jgi:ABC-type multidrug transport system ATPase subunit
MSERILKALMQLFAILAKTDDEASIENGRLIVLAFLKSQLNSELVDEYLHFYNEFLEQHHKISDSTKSKKRTSVNSVKVLRICTQINEELLQRQKLIVLIRLIEFINANGAAGEQELEFAQTVAQTFNIEDHEYRLIFDFVNYKQDSLFTPEKVLLINSESTSDNEKMHLRLEGLNGEIRVMCIESTGMYLMKYFGKTDLYLNGQSVNNHKVHIFTQGSSIRGSKIKALYYSDVVSKFLTSGNQSKIIFEAIDVEYRFKSGKLGVRGLRLNEESGSLIGIMGGSGAGKSTVLNILNGNEIPSAGKVCINGIDIHKDKYKIQGVIGHVSQDDLLIEELTVYQNLFYNAKLCFADKSDSEIRVMVLNLLTDIGLQDTIDLKVGSPLEKTISGGQRKRLNIALELIREPAVLFVDEPTSGLSSRDSENIMDLLKELSLKGKLVFVVIHQPSSDIFKMFDKLLILDLGGYPIYYGNPVESVIYFKTLIHHVNANESECITCGNVNPEQIFNIIETKVLDEYGNETLNRRVSPKEWNEFFKERLQPALRIDKSDVEIPESTFKKPNKIEQFKVFITRDVLSKLTNKQYLIINFLETPVLAFILSFLVKFYNTDVSNKVGYKYFENENLPAYVLMAVVIALFVGLTVSAEEIIRDRRIQKRESFLNLSKGSYLFSKIVIMFTLSAIQTATFVIIGNTMLGIHGMYLDYWGVLFSASCFANMLGLNISASFNSAVTIYILIPFLIIPQLILSGVIVKFEKLNPKIASQTMVPFWGEMMASRWAYEAIAVNQYKNNAYQKSIYKLEKTKSTSDYLKNLWIPKMRAKLDECQNNFPFKSPIMKRDFMNGIMLLKNEILRRNASSCPVKFIDVESIDEAHFNENLIATLKNYFKEFTAFQMRKYNNANREEDAVVGLLTHTDTQREAYAKLKEECDNEQLNSLVRNTNDLNKIIEFNGRFIQRSEPIYHDPERDQFLRAHFFAPRKSIFGNYIDTYWVNIGVIWFMCIMLVITLYFNVLKRFLDSFEAISDRIKHLRKRSAKK